MSLTVERIREYCDSAVWNWNHAGELDGESDKQSFCHDGWTDFRQSGDDKEYRRLRRAHYGSLLRADRFQRFEDHLPLTLT